MRWSRVSKAYHFLKKLANCVDSILFHCFYDALNFVSKRSHRMCSKFATIEAIIWQVQTLLSDFLKKTPGTKKHKDKYKTKWRRYVVMVTPIAIMGFICNRSHHGNVTPPFSFIFIFVFLCTRSFFFKKSLIRFFILTAKKTVTNSSRANL